MDYTERTQKPTFSDHLLKRFNAHKITVLALTEKLQKAINPNLDETWHTLLTEVDTKNGVRYDLVYSVSSKELRILVAQHTLLFHGTDAAEAAEAWLRHTGQN